MYDNVGNSQSDEHAAYRACAAKKAVVRISDNCLSILSKIICYLYRTFKVTFVLAFPTLIFTIRFPFFNAFTLIVIFPAFFVIFFTLIFFPDTFTASVVTFFGFFAATLITIFTVFPFFALIFFFTATIFFAGFFFAAGVSLRTMTLGFASGVALGAALGLTLGVALNWYLEPH